MAEVDSAELQQHYGGRYVALVDGTVIASADTYRDLSAQLERMATKWDKLVIEYVEPASSVGVY